MPSSMALRVAREGDWLRDPRFSEVYLQVTIEFIQRQLANEGIKATAHVSAGQVTVEGEDPRIPDALGRAMRHQPEIWKRVEERLGRRDGRVHWVDDPGTQQRESEASMARAVRRHG